MIRPRWAAAWRYGHGILAIVFYSIWETGLEHSKANGCINKYYTLNSHTLSLFFCEYLVVSQWAKNAPKSWTTPAPTLVVTSQSSLQVQPRNPTSADDVVPSAQLRIPPPSHHRHRPQTTSTPPLSIARNQAPAAYPTRLIRDCLVASPAVRRACRTADSATRVPPTAASTPANTTARYQTLRPSPFPRRQSV